LSANDLFFLFNSMYVLSCALVFFFSLFPSSRIFFFFFHFSTPSHLLPFPSHSLLFLSFALLFCHSHPRCVVRLFCVLENRCMIGTSRSSSAAILNEKSTINPRRERVCRAITQPISLRMPTNYPSQLCRLSALLRVVTDDHSIVVTPLYCSF